MRFAAARSVEEAVSIMSTGGDVRPMLGGTDVMVELNTGAPRPDVLLGLSRLAAFTGWRREGGVVRLGAAITYTEIAEGPVAGLLPALTQAAGGVGSRQIRNRGTLGGSVAKAAPCADALPPLLVALAEVELEGSSGVRIVSLREALAGDAPSTRGADELVAAVRVAPLQVPQAFLRIAPRTAVAPAACTLALALDREREEARVAFGSGAGGPISLSSPLADAEELPDRVASSAASIDGDGDPASAYRHHALRVLARRALEHCRDR